MNKTLKELGEEIDERAEAVKNLVRNMEQTLSGIGFNFDGITPRAHLPGHYIMTAFVDKLRFDLIGMAVTGTGFVIRGMSAGDPGDRGYPLTIHLTEIKAVTPVAVTQEDVDREYGANLGRYE